MNRLDDFTEAYLECALWANNLDDLHVGDIPDDLVKQAIDDCRDFQQANEIKLAKQGTDEQNGHDFYLTREGHGAGFWDRGTGPVGKLLTEAAHVYGSWDDFTVWALEQAEDKKNPFRPGSAESFFWQHAGWSHAPAKQTPEEGRRECAENLARAERIGSEAGLSFVWERETITDESFRDTDAPYYLWHCACFDMDGECKANVGAVDFGPPPKEPWGDPYRRVIEAELAQEATHP